LKNWLNFIFVIEKVWIALENLSSFHFSLWIRNENSCRRAVNVVIRLDFGFRNIILSITELFPIIIHGPLLHLHILISFLFSFALSLPFLNLSAHSHFFLPLLHIGLLHSLLFNESRVWLHIDWNNKSCESITTNNTPIIHDVLGRDLTVNVKNRIRWF
jgi:hypothetical protein